MVCVWNVFFISFKIIYRWCDTNLYRTSSFPLFHFSKQLFNCGTICICTSNFRLSIATVYTLHIYDNLHSYNLREQGYRKYVVLSFYWSFDIENDFLIANQTRSKFRCSMFLTRNLIGCKLIPQWILIQSVARDPKHQLIGQH